MSLAVLSGTIFSNHIFDLLYVCVLLIFFSFYVKDVYIKHHLRYIAPFAGILLLYFIDSFVTSQDGMISFSALRKLSNGLPYPIISKYEYIVSFFLGAILLYIYFFVISVVLDFGLYVAGRFIRKLRHRIRGM